MLLKINTTGMNEEKRNSITRLLCVYATRGIINCCCYYPLSNTIYFEYSNSLGGLKAIRDKIGASVTIV